MQVQCKSALKNNSECVIILLIVINRDWLVSGRSITWIRGMDGWMDGWLARDFMSSRYKTLLELRCRLSSSPTGEYETEARAPLTRKMIYRKVGDRVKDRVGWV